MFPQSKIYFPIMQSYPATTKSLLISEPTFSYHSLNDDSEQKQSCFLNEDKSPSMAPPVQSMEAPVKSLQRDYRWRNIPTLDQSSGIAFCADLCKVNEIYLRNDPDKVNCADDLYRLSQFGLTPINGMFRCCYSYFGNTQNQDSCGSVCLDKTCGVFACTLSCIYRIVCHISTTIILCPLCCAKCCCGCCYNDEFESFAPRLLNNFKHNLQEKNLPELFAIIKNTTANIRDEIIYKHGKEFLYLILQDKDTLTQENKKQLIAYISERQLPYLYNSEALSLALVNNSPDVMEILKFFLDENNFCRFAFHENLYAANIALTDSLNAKKLSLNDVLRRITLLKQYGVILMGELGLSMMRRETVIGFFREKQNLGKDLLPIIGDYAFSP